MVLQVNSDIRGIEKIFDIPSTPAEYACFKCWKQGVHLVHKMCYCQHQSHLPVGHPLRFALQNLNKPPNAPPRNVDSILVPADRTSEQLWQGELTHQ
jgi:hypothetical protein